MKLIVGLGNKGEKYNKTRHNVGFLVLGVLGGHKWKRNKKFEAEVCDFDLGDILLIKPMTFMNESGRAVRKIIDYYNIELDDLYVIHDDLDLKLGRFKIQKSKGPKDHNGILSIERMLGSKDFWRVRVGIDNREKKQRGWIVGDDYVLSEFGEDESELLNKVIGEVVAALEAMLE